ncbi:MAG: hypothetical protein K0M40_22505 [Prolixibacteraceae bacterium]|nr:hypothetical protein [Prolixibacteraceae bacterium]
MKFIKRIPTTSRKAIGTRLSKFKGTYNPRNQKAEVGNCFYYLDNAADINQDISSITYIGDHAADKAKSILDYLISKGHGARIVSQSPPVKIFQVTLQDLLPNDKATAIWMLDLKSNRIEAEVRIHFHGESVIIGVRFDFTSSNSDHPKGKYRLVIHSFNQFRSWYLKTFDI